MLAIQKGVPLPAASHELDALSLALRALDVGDSVLVPDEDLNYRAVRVRAAKLGRSGEKKFSTRREGNATRVWRVPLTPTDDLA